MVDLATDPSSRRRRRRHTTARATTESSLSRSMQEILGIPCFDNDLSSSFNVDNSTYVNSTSSNLSQCERGGGTRHRRRGSIDMLGGAPLNNDERHQPSAFRTLEGQSRATTPATKKKPKYNMGKSPGVAQSPGITTNTNASTTATDPVTSNSSSRSRRQEIASPGSGRRRRTIILSPTPPVTPPVTSVHDRPTPLATTSRRGSDTSTPTTPTGRGRRRLSPQSTKPSTETHPKSESPRLRFRYYIPKLGLPSPQSPSNAANNTANRTASPTTMTAPIAEDEDRSSPRVKGDWYLSMPKTSVTSVALRKRRDDKRRSSPPPSITTASSIATAEQSSGHSRRSPSHHSRTSTTSDSNNGGVGTLFNLVKGGTPKGAKKTLKAVSDRIQKLSNHRRPHIAHSYHSRSVTVDDRPIPYSTMPSTLALDDHGEVVDDHFHHSMLSIGSENGDPTMDRQSSTVKFLSGPRLKSTTSSIGLPPKSPSRSRRSGVTDDLLHQSASTISLGLRSPNIGATSCSNKPSTPSSPSTKKASLAQTLLSQKKSPRSLQASMNGLIVGFDVDRGTPNKGPSANNDRRHQKRKNEKLTLPSMLPL